MTTPNQLITPAMWRLWTDRPVVGWKLGGIYANKRGYHNTVDANRSKWPGDYSIRYALDSQGPRNRARAIDYTMSDADMRKYTQRLLDAAGRNDPRMKPVREFYGTVNGKVVVGRIRNNDTEAYRASTSDSSHLWHIHVSVWTAYCDNWAVLSGIISILSGQSLGEWRGDERGGVMLPKRGDGSANGMDEIVRYWQRRLDRLGFKSKDGKRLTFDGEYQAKTQEAVSASRTAYGYGSPGHPAISGTHAERMDAELVELLAREGPPGPAPTSQQLLAAVIAWASDNPTLIVREVSEWLEAHRAELKGDKGDPGDPPPILAVSGTLTVQSELET